MISPGELERLWHDHARALELVARGRCQSADDCVQEAFIRLARQSPIPDDPAAWLFQTVRNLASNQARSARRSEHHQNRAAQLRTPWVEPAEIGQRTDADEAQRLTAALAALADEDREILVGHLWGKLTFRQLAVALDVSPMTVHRRYRQAMEAVRQHWIANAARGAGDLP